MKEEIFTDREKRDTVWVALEGLVVVKSPTIEESERVWPPLTCCNNAILFFRATLNLPIFSLSVPLNWILSQRKETF